VRVGIAIKEIFEIENAVITINRYDNGGSLSASELYNTMLLYCYDSR